MDWQFKRADKWRSAPILGKLQSNLTIAELPDTPSPCIQTANVPQAHVCLAARVYAHRAPDYCSHHSVAVIKPAHKLLEKVPGLWL